MIEVGSALAVQATAEFLRIASVGRRDPDTLLKDLDMHAAASRALRTTTNDRKFRAIQAAALVSSARSVEAGNPGAFLPIGVGEGKTDITFCLPLVLQSARAVLTVPGKLTTSKPAQLGKTERDFKLLRPHWLEREYGQILSYERLGRAKGGDLLEAYAPDLLVSDEAHNLRNRETAACARVVEDYVRRSRAAGRRVIWIVLSGTMTAGSIIDMAHLSELTLGPSSFLPNDTFDLDMWRRAVDADVEAGGRVAPGVLLSFPHEPKGSQLARARTAVQRRMHETEGVIASIDTGVKASLQFGYAGDAGGGGADAEAWRVLRKGWWLPNGEQCVDGFEYHRHAREYALGYWSDWDPQPPREWRAARKAWARIVHELVSERLCNTEVEARTYADRDEDMAEVRDEWLKIRHVYRPEDHRVARWLSTATLEACAAWAKKHKSGIIWTQSVPFGERLEKDFGIPYYREEGLRSDGQYIEQASGLICASVQANFEGRNLQFQWADNLFVSPYGSAARLEQNIGRTHRQLQKADVVTCDWMLVCLEHVNALRRARDRASAIQQLTKNPQKLVYGDWTFDPATYVDKSKPQWRSSIKDEDDSDDDALFNILSEGI